VTWKTQKWLRVMTAAFRVPKKVKLVKGLAGVKLVEEPQFARTHKLPKGSKRRGLIYQDRVVDYLERRMPESWEALPGPWFEFVDAKGHHYAQADWLGIDVTQGRICLVEIKLNRVPDAWWQLNRRYLPLVQKLFPQFEIGMVEIATSIRNFVTPTPVNLISNIAQVEPNKTSFLRVPYDPVS
jgi:hypothetical protein